MTVALFVALWAVLLFAVFLLTAGPTIERRIEDRAAKMAPERRTRERGE
jgi:hypothetical protein